MKHVFFIQSNITYIAAQSIIHHQKIDLNEVRFLVLNHFNKINFPYKVYDFEQDFVKLFRPQSFFSRIFSEDSQLKLFDEKFNHFIDYDNFILYLPNVYGKNKQAFINHKNCVQVNFLEEGMMAYSYTETYKGDFYKNLNFREKFFASISRFLFRFRKRRQFAPKHFFDIAPISKKYKSIFFGFSSKAFEKYKIKNMVVTPMVTINTKTKLPEKSTVFILDALPENNHVNYQRFIKSITDFLKKTNSKNYIKFHPLQSQKTIQDITSFCKNKNIDIEILDRSIIVEDIIINSKNLEFYGYISALLFYAKLNHHKVHCLLYEFKDDQNFKEYLTKQDFNYYELLSNV